MVLYIDDKVFIPRYGTLHPALFSLPKTTFEDLPTELRYKIYKWKRLADAMSLIRYKMAYYTLDRDNPLPFPMPYDDPTTPVASFSTRRHWPFYLNPHIWYFTPRTMMYNWRAGNPEQKITLDILPENKERKFDRMKRMLEKRLRFPKELVNADKQCFLLENTNKRFYKYMDFSHEWYFWPHDGTLEHVTPASNGMTISLPRWRKGRAPNLEFEAKRGILENILKFPRKLKMGPDVHMALSQQYRQQGRNRVYVHCWLMVEGKLGQHFRIEVAGL